MQENTWFFFYAVSAKYLSSETKEDRDSDFICFHLELT